jgi:hypothetical protein
LFEQSKLMAEGWNGTEWTLQKASEPVGATNSMLNGVWCKSATTCIATGRYNTNHTLNLGWAGAEWSVESTPNLGEWSELRQVWCASYNECIATGWGLSTTGEVVTLAEESTP